jgi:hypothetical protein
LPWLVVLTLSGHWLRLRRYTRLTLTLLLLAIIGLLTLALLVDAPEVKSGRSNNPSTKKPGGATAHRLQMVSG